jgi:hypothetical protein
MGGALVEASGVEVISAREHEAVDVFEEGEEISLVSDGRQGDGDSACRADALCITKRERESISGLALVEEAVDRDEGCAGVHVEILSGREAWNLVPTVGTRAAAL